MSRARSPRRSPVPRLSPATAALLGLLAGCASKSSGTTTVAAGTVEQSDKIPISTASAEARTLYLQARALTDQLRAHDGRALFEQAVAKDPSFAMAHYNLAVSAATPRVLSEEVTLAVAHSATATEGERLLILALHARSNAEPAKALQYNEQLAAMFPRDERAHLALGLAYFGQQDYEKAAGEFRRAIEIDSSYSPAYNMLGYAYRPLGKNAEAEAAYKGYIRLIPNDPNPYDSYAEFLMKVGRFDESIAAYEKALSIDPHFTGSFIGITADRIFKSQNDEAIAQAQKLYDSARDDGDRRQALFSQAVADVDAGKTDRALQRLHAEYALDARIADTAAMSADAVAMGDVLLDAGKPDDARARYALALTLVMTSGQPASVKEDAKLADRYNSARVALAKHDLSMANADAEAYAIGARAKHNVLRIRQAHELAGLIALHDQKFAIAVTELEQANRQDPSVLYAMARAYQGAGDAASARKWAAAAANANTLPTLPYAFVRIKAKQMM